MSESLKRIEKFLGTRRTMRGIDQTEIAQLNAGAADEARLLTADLEQLVKLSSLAIQANRAVTEHKISEFNSDHPSLAAFQRSYADLIADYGKIPMTTSTVQMQLDDVGGIQSAGDRFTLQDGTGNAVTISLKAVLRCLAIAESEKMVSQLPDEFWQSVQHVK